MALEDYTTYDETDPDNEITVGANKITVALTSSGDNAHVTDDKGAAHFGDFEHLFDAQTTNSFDTQSCLMWGVSDDFYTHTSMDTNNEGLSVQMIGVSGVDHRVRLHCYVTPDSDTHALAADNDRHYYTVERNDTTLTCKIYADAIRTDLKDTLTITCTNDTYKAIIAFGNLQSGAADGIYLDIDNLDLQEAGGPHPHPLADTAKAVDTIKFDVQEHMADTAKAADTPSFWTGRYTSLADTAKAADALVREAQIPIADTAKAADDSDTNAGLNLADNPKAADSETTQVEMPIADNPKAADAIGFIKGFLHNIGDTAKAADSVIRNAGKTLADNAKGSDTISFLKARFYAIADTAKAADALAKNVGKTIADGAKAIDALITNPHLIFDIAKASDIVSYLKSAINASAAKLKGILKNETRLNIKSKNETGLKNIFRLLSNANKINQ